MKWFLACLCLVAPAAGLSAVTETEQLTATGVFATLPHEVLDMLRPSTRLDMIDYYTQADSLVTVTEALGGTSRLEQVAPDYLKVSLTPVSTLEIKILPYGKKQIVMTIYTTGDSDMAKDSDVRFFDSNMKDLPVDRFLKDPAVTDFFDLRGSGISEKELMEMIPFISVEYASGPGDVPLKASLTSLRIISEDERELLTSILTPTLTARWKKGFRF